MGVGEDKISALPDSVLHHILSFLPTKLAVGTSILSKRWRFLWTCLPNLDFEYTPEAYCPDEARRFMNYVERVLLLHHMSNIQKFSLEWNSTCDEFRVNSWISLVSSQRVQELSLFAYMDEPFRFPHSLYTCEFLTVLKLSKPGVFNLPTSSFLPSLKTLHLEYIHFTDECLTQKLFSSCPVLEELFMEMCAFVSHEVLLVSFPSLKYLTISRTDFGALNGERPGCAIKICTPNLVRIVCSTSCWGISSDVNGIFVLSSKEYKSSLM